ncbi:protein tag-52-related [Anaeramoeba flamelloides]|uniref:Protein tag-52-related n=1 Tax=Anaeramoeba flamelloides TaxID=1746091 RepID=A0AAV7ZFJ4_9EUKA|nr:protein tag-52-related [Anaeramoeba flamelloides]
MSSVTKTPTQGKPKRKINTLRSKPLSKTPRGNASKGLNAKGNRSTGLFNKPNRPVSKKKVFRATTYTPQKNTKRNTKPTKRKVFKTKLKTKTNTKSTPKPKPKPKTTTKPKPRLKTKPKPKPKTKPKTKPKPTPKPKSKTSLKANPDLKRKVQKKKIDFKRTNDKSQNMNDKTGNFKRSAPFKKNKIMPVHRQIIKKKNEKSNSRSMQIRNVKRIQPKQSTSTNKKQEERKNLKKISDPKVFDKKKDHTKIFNFKRQNKVQPHSLKTNNFTNRDLKNAQATPKKETKLGYLKEPRIKTTNIDHLRIQNQQSKQIEILEKKLKEQEKINSDHLKNEKQMALVINRLRNQLKEKEKEKEKQKQIAIAIENKNNFSKMEKNNLQNKIQKEKLVQEKFNAKLQSQFKFEKSKLEKIINDKNNEIQRLKENLQKKTQEFKRIQLQKKVNEPSDLQKTRGKKTIQKKDNSLNNLKRDIIQDLKTQNQRPKPNQSIKYTQRGNFELKNDKLLRSKDITIDRLYKQLIQKNKLIDKLKNEKIAANRTNQGFEKQLQDKEKIAKNQKLQINKFKQNHNQNNRPMNKYKKRVFKPKESQRSQKTFGRARRTITIQALLRKHLQQKRHSKEYQRISLCKEIFYTEKEYVNRIKLLLNEFLQPLKDFEEISQEEINQIINELTIILNLSGKILLNLKSTSQGKELIGKVFAQFSAAMIVYTTYVNRYSTFDSHIRKNITNNEKLKNFLTEKKLQSDLRLGLFDLLIAPIQRIPKYSLLLKSLKKYTSINHPDYIYIDTALKQITKQAELLNKKRKQFSNLNQLFEISQKINSSKNKQELNLLDKPSRKFICTAKITHYDENSVRSRIAILFNDLLIIVKKKNSHSFFIESKENYYYNLKSVLLFNKPLKIIDLTDENNNKQNLIEIQSPNLQRNLILQFEDEIEKLKWIEKLNKSNQKVTEQALNTTQNIGSESSINEIDVNNLNKNNLHSFPLNENNK